MSLERAANTDRLWKQLGESGVVWATNTSTNTTQSLMKVLRIFCVELEYFHNTAQWDWSIFAPPLFLQNHGLIYKNQKSLNSDEG